LAPQLIDKSPDYQITRLPNLLLFIAVLLLASPLAALNPEVLRALRAVPPEIAGRFREPAGFQAAASGQYFVFDRRAHTVYGIDAEHSSTWPIVQIGAEEGRIIDPSAFSVAPDGTFVVADAPNNRERIQIFSPVGFRIGGFLLPGRLRPRVVFNHLVVGGIGSLLYTGSSILISQPDAGALISEYTLSGGVNRFIGTLRPTGHEDDPELHLALNAGLPLVDPTGGFFLVFQTGEPTFRKYDRTGQLLYERHIQGREIDEFVAKLPTTWPHRQTADGEFAVVSPTIRTAAVDSNGRLWVTFVLPYTYIFDADGDKLAVLQFRGAGIVSPTSLFFDGKGRLLVTPGLSEYPVWRAGTKADR
jgi:hypothetical protein